MSHQQQFDKFKSTHNQIIKHPKFKQATSKEDDYLVLNEVKYLINDSANFITNEFSLHRNNAVILLHIISFF